MVPRIVSQPVCRPRYLREIATDGAIRFNLAILIAILIERQRLPHTSMLPSAKTVLCMSAGLRSSDRRSFADASVEGC
jgi:hypothetical protein